MARRRTKTTTTGVVAVASGFLLLAAPPLLPGAGAFFLAPACHPSSRQGMMGGSGVVSGGQGWTAAAASATRLFHSPDASAAPATAPAPQTDAAVPEGHKGLHSYLYGDGATEDAHGSSSGSGSGGSGYVQFTRGTVHAVEEWLAQYDSSPGQPKVAGVYGVYDDFGGLRYVGVSRDVGLTLRAHRRVQGSKAVGGVAVQSFRFPKREEMANYQAMWLAELAALPEGNKEDEQGGGASWAASIKEAVEAGAADAARRAAYEETKAKLRTAMADPTLLDELEDLDESDEDDDPEASAAARREALRRAAGGGATAQGDWSAEVEAQTRATLPPKDSPFEGNGGKGGKEVTAGLEEEETLELTPGNVDKVLDEVRPYLISDGGNIEVVRVETDTRNIYLRLQGACGSCPSSTVTMKMGVERVLREKFTGLGLVEAIAPEAEIPTDADGRPLTETEALKQKLEAKLGEILPAIRGLGASATIASVSNDGVVGLSFQGPDKVRLGVVYALKALPGVTDVVPAA